MIALNRLREKPVYFYTPSIPRPSGDGFMMRTYTNARAFLDLGFAVEVIVFSNVPSHPLEYPNPEGRDVKITEVISKPVRPTLLDRIAYQVGFPFEAVLNVSFPSRKQVQAEVMKRENCTPGAIHHFESISMASAAIGIKGLNAIYSCHDSVVKRNVVVFMMREEVEKVQKSDRRRKLRINYLQRSEREVAASCKLVLAIAAHEKEELRQNLGYSHIELLPMSWPNEETVTRMRRWLEDGKLRLLHVGKVDDFLGYYSLKFLLEEVFPRVPKDVLDKIELFVAGELGNSAYTNRILEKARSYPQVRFLGYVDDLRSLYGSTDLHVVGTDRATGLRTRIIESFVYGLPVLSTSEAAAGVVGLQAGKNILLADDASSYAQVLTNLFEAPIRLGEIAAEARRTYDENYSRRVEAAALAKFLEYYL